MVKEKAVILVSGGLDSATCLAIANDQGYESYALTISYGQRHHHELEAAKKVVAQLEACQHKFMHIDLTLFGGSALTDHNIHVPDHQPDSTLIPITYVPARNTIFLSLALAWAEVIEADNLFIGVGAVDYSGYPDCRPDFISSFEATANKACARWVESDKKLTIHAPLLHLSKSEVITYGNRLGVDYALTHSCYNPDETGLACGQCDSCSLRKKAFIEADIKDPTRYMR